MKCLFWVMTLVISVLSYSQSAKNRYDYIPDVSDSVIKARLKSIQGEISLEFNQTVKNYIQFYTVRKRDYTRKILNRSTKYFPIFEKYLSENNMPDELKYLSVVESGLKPNAISHAAAVGLWQFIYSTGKRYNLNSNWYYDDRMDPEKSTQAACDFLSYLYKYFGDWKLSLAGYNSGRGRVNRAIRYAGGRRDFWAIYDYLPRETRAYVPKFVAVTYVFNFAEEHNLYPDNPEYLPAYDTVSVNQYLNLDIFAQQAGWCIEDLEYLNPQIKQSALPSTSKNYGLKVPLEVKKRINENRLEIFDSASRVGRVEIEKMAANEVGAVAGRKRILYKVKSGDVMSTIAQRYNIRVSDIKKWNRKSTDLIRVGEILKIWIKPSIKSSIQRTPTVQRQSKAVQPKTGQKIYKVKSGDTLWKISLDNNISIEKIKNLNKLSSDNIKPGQTLIISE